LSDKIIIGKTFPDNITYSLFEPRNLPADVSTKADLAGGHPLQEKNVTADNPIEQSTRLTPKFNDAGLIPVIAQDAKTGDVLMFAYMNKESLDETIKTGLATYYSRSRKKLWKKGEQSGHVQKVEQILIDCDQDCILLKVTVDSGQCHAGYQSCFYRALKKGTLDQLDFTAEKVFDPSKVYDK